MKRDPIKQIKSDAWESVFEDAHDRTRPATVTIPFAALDGLRQRIANCAYEYEDDWEDLSFIDCITCNKNVCEAYDEGVKTGQRMAARGVWRYGEGA